MIKDIFIFMFVVLSSFLLMVCKYKKFLIELIKNIVNVYPDIEQKLNKAIDDIQNINYQVEVVKENKFKNFETETINEINIKREKPMKKIKVKCQLCENYFTPRGLPIHLRACKNK